MPYWLKRKEKVKLGHLMDDKEVSERDIKM
jgi:hypothetical protein